MTSFDARTFTSYAAAAAVALWSTTMLVVATAAPSVSLAAQSVA